MDPVRCSEHSSKKEEKINFPDLFFSAFKHFLYLVLPLTLLLSIGTEAQTRHEINDQSSHFILLGGYSPLSVKLLGKTPYSQTTFFYTGFRIPLNTRLFKLDAYYSAGIYPFISYDYSKRDDNGNKDIAQGYGISPVGFFMTREISERFVWALSSQGGIMFMDKTFPTDRSRRLNYTFDVTTEMIFNTGQDFSLSFGYKFHHISNAQTGEQNPGLDSNILFLSIII